MDDLAGGRRPRNRHVLVIHNPAAGRRRQRRLAATLHALRSHDCTFELRATTRGGDAEAIVRSAAAGYDAVVAAGGDGTINEVVNGLVTLAPPRPALAVIPLGTANVLATELGLTGRPAQTARVIATAPPRPLHLGMAADRHFVMMASAGFDAQVVADLSLARKRQAGRLAYVMEALEQLWRYPYPPLRVVADDTEYEAFTVVACNGRHYGGPFVAAPAADLGRPELQVVMLRRGGWRATVRYTLALAAGRLSRLPDVTIVAARRLTISGPPGAPVQADGDLVATLAVDIAVAERSVTVLAPASSQCRSQARYGPSY